MKHLIIENRNEGFFSNFNLIAGSLSYMYDNNIKEFNVIWKNSFYQTSDYNMFDEYFYKQNFYDNYDVIYRAHELSVSMFNFFTPIEVFKKLNTVMNYYGCFNNHAFKLANEQSIENSNSLGVHVRRTDHHRHGLLLDDEYYFSKIDQNLENDNYDNIFISTDDLDVIITFRNRYGSKLFYNDDIVRNTGSISIHHSNYSNKEKLASDVMRDALSMTKCKKILTTASNVTGYVLIVNPNIDYEQIDTHISYG